MNNISKLLLTLLALIVFVACDDDDTMDPATVNFTTTAAGITPDNPSATLTLSFSRAVTSAGEVSLNITPGDLVYGDAEDFYTSPSAVGNVITVSYAQGVEQVSFEVISGSGLNIEEDQQIQLSIGDTDPALVAGVNQTITVNFAENFVSESGILEINGGGEEFPNQSYLDISKNQESNVSKDSWDLGFYSGAGHHVVLNAVNSTMARPLETSDLNAVTAADTVGFGYEMSVPPPNFDPSIGAAAWVDTPDGNLETTAIAPVSATEDENLVYILKRPGKDWKKIQVIQDADNYVLRYADIDATEYATVSISKNADYNFTFIDITEGEVTVEPNKNNWDFMYSLYTEIIPVGPDPTAVIPYSYKDYITINRNGTEVAMVMEADIAYDEFTAADIDSQEFDGSVNAIGSSWRSGGGPTSGPALFDDRYYVLRDSEGNVFKLKFTRLYSTEGERGYPEFKYDVLYR